MVKKNDDSDAIQGATGFARVRRLGDSSFYSIFSFALLEFGPNVFSALFFAGRRTLQVVSNMEEGWKMEFEVDNVEADTCEGSATWKQASDRHGGVLKNAG